MRLYSIAALVAAFHSAHAIDLNSQDPGSIRGVSHKVVSNLVSMMPGGLLPQAPQYYWWESGGSLGGLLEYWHATGDGSQNAMITQGLLSQKTAANNFRTGDCTGNDDQGWWALTAMSAAEYGLPQVPGNPSWLSLAQNVFQEFTTRWDPTTCNGGMGWQIASGASGFHYKNSISNGLFFQLAARLARFTGNPDYTNWANKIYDWTTSVGLIDNDFKVYDGADATKNCVGLDHNEWSYNVGVFLYGAAVMQDYTNDPKWAPRTTGLIKSTGSFLKDGVLFEKQCEVDGKCNTDQQFFKAFLSRWLAATAVMVPSTQGAISPILGASATAAAATCASGGQQLCGSRWYTKAIDTVTGAGSQLAVLDVMNGLLTTSTGKPGKASKKAKRFAA
ncbi:glycoside hydrolase [Microthyrium microscopicum]|uniref:mannan endo-1,6-alpha-mannosidase n=1 Tax=Microthyrium microscopicum TaxID=703497 RepID=A0A6A6UDC6_9PEZI|nr:glycoside hydrolase [Microthyrium microscopicum]